MRKKSKFQVMAGIAVLSLSLTILACAPQGQEGAGNAVKQPLVVDATGKGGAADKGKVRIVKNQLANTDCIKCHVEVVHQNMDDGGKHKSEVGCLDCHTGGHPPEVEKEKIIPQCSMCHEGEPHYEVDNCLRCHQNPHQPLHIVFGEENSEVCNTCHSDKGEELSDNPSAHGEVDCAVCHHDQHGYIPDCMECHDPHRDGQQTPTCAGCHPVHSPLNIGYDDKVPNMDCGACHDELEATLAAGETKHAQLLCVFCHKDKHGFVPTCQDCHGVPHPDKMMSKFPNCIDCHEDPHDLVM